MARIHSFAPLAFALFALTLPSLQASAAEMQIAPLVETIHDEATGMVTQLTVKPGEKRPHIVFESPDKKIDVLLILPEPSVSVALAKTQQKNGAQKLNADATLNFVKQQRKLIQDQQAQTIRSLRAKLPQLKVRTQIDTLLNAVALTVTQRDMPTLASYGRVEPDYRVKATGLDWWQSLKQKIGFGAPARPEITGTGAGQIIAVLDTGVDYTHPDLGGCLGATCKVIGGYDFIDNDTDPMDEHKHGTHVAGIAAGKGGVMGVAPDAKILAIRVLDKNGFGDTSKIIKGIEYALDPDGNPATNDGAHIANMSLGGGGTPQEAMAKAVDAATEKGMLVVAAAGNDGRAMSIGSPGVADTALTVGAVDQAGNLASFSSRGPVVGGKTGIKPDLVAPGVNIRSTVLKSQYEELSGTSMATPYVAGVAAVLREKYPHLEASALKANLQVSAQRDGSPITHKGAGIADLSAALNSPLEVDSGDLHAGWTDPASETVSFTRTISFRNRTDLPVRLSVFTQKHVVPQPSPNTTEIEIAARKTTRLNFSLTHALSNHPFDTDVNNVKYGTMVMDTKTTPLHIDNSIIHARELVIDSQKYEAPSLLSAQLISDDRADFVTLYNTNGSKLNAHTTRYFSDISVFVVTAELMTDVVRTSYHTPELVKRSYAIFPRQSDSPNMLNFKISSASGEDFSSFPKTNTPSIKQKRNISFFLKKNIMTVESQALSSPVYFPNNLLFPVISNWDRFDSTERRYEHVSAKYANGISSDTNTTISQHQYQHHLVHTPKLPTERKYGIAPWSGFLTSQLSFFTGFYNDHLGNGLPIHLYSTSTDLGTLPLDSAIDAFSIFIYEAENFKSVASAPALNLKGGKLRFNQSIHQDFNTSFQAFSEKEKLGIGAQFSVFNHVPSHAQMSCAAPKNNAPPIASRTYATWSGDITYRAEQVDAPALEGQHPNNYFAYCNTFFFSPISGSFSSNGIYTADFPHGYVAGIAAKSSARWVLSSPSNLPPRLVDLYGENSTRTTNRLGPGSWLGGKAHSLTPLRTVHLSIRPHGSAEWMQVNVNLDGLSFTGPLPQALSNGAYDLKVRLEDVDGNSYEQTSAPTFEWLASIVDRDEDGYLDSEDAFPDDDAEWIDSDRDGVGNNRDTDDDNDCTSDIRDEMPLDPAETLDSDKDGVGNNSDTDDDNDGVLDVNDAFPLDRNESVDTDRDGIGNNADTDDDNDGVLDANDAFPLDRNESLDTDRDGIGNNADTDDDNDSVLDANDAFPLDKAESVDTDLDGIGNNADTDDDNDSVLDSSDAFPLDKAESVDTDRDGIGNNADNDDDNDGHLDSADAFPLDASRWVNTPPPPPSSGGGGGGSAGFSVLVFAFALRHRMPCRKTQTRTPAQRRASCLNNIF